MLRPLWSKTEAFRLTSYAFSRSVYRPFSLPIGPSSVPGATASPACGRGSGSGAGTGSRSTVSGGCAAACTPATDCCIAHRGAHPRSRAAQATPEFIQPGPRILFRRCIVPLAEMDSQLRQSRRRLQFHLELAPVAVVSQVGGRVADHVLVAQLRGDAGRNVPKVVEIVRHIEQPPPGHLADLVQQGRPAHLFGGRRVAVEDADGIDLHVALAHYFAQLTLL